MNSFRANLAPRRKQVSQGVCPITGKPLTQPGATVHPDAWQQLAPFLTKLHHYQSLLQAALGKQLNRKSPTCRYAQESTAPIDLALLEPAWIIRNDIETWTKLAGVYLAVHVPTDRTWQVAQQFWRWAIEKPRLCVWEDAPEAVDALRDAWRILTRVIDIPNNAEFIGMCPYCATALYLPRRRETLSLTCRNCHQNVTFKEAKTAAIQIVGYLWLTSTQAVQAAALLAGQPPISRATLDTWVSRGQIETRTYRGRKLYQPKQIVDRLRRVS